jgi:hypothetical protein
MKERDDNPIGPLLLDHLHEKNGKALHLSGKDSNSRDLAAEKITCAISQHFSGGPNII